MIRKLVYLPNTEILGVHDYLGTEYANDEPSQTYQQRRGRCYELAAYAMAFGSAPAGSVLVHGSWQGPGARRRIGHAWLLLPLDKDGPIGSKVWEPITAAIYPGREFREQTRAWDEVHYSLTQLRGRLALTGHYGRWHASKHP